jgi:hypothetical protein
MKSLKKAFEIIKAIFYMPLYISKVYKRSEDLVRIEKKLYSFAVRLNEKEESASDLLNLAIKIEQGFENQFLQFESLLAVYRALPDLKLLPPTRGWAGSPDFLAKITEVILKEKPSFVFEVSSGVSTIIIGLALKLNNYGEVMSIDHESQYAKVTEENIDLNEIKHVSTIQHCPIVDYSSIESGYKWYETKNLNIAKKIDLLVIDGPPRTTQVLARYPAIPLLHKHFADKTLILLDDSNRKDEIIIVQKWILFLESSNYKVLIHRFNNFEKGLVILEVYRL